MKTGKTSAATLGLVGGLALGVWIGSELTSSRADATPQPAAVTTQAVEEPAAPAAPAKPKRVTRVARAASGAAVEAPAPESAPKLVMTIPVSAPELHARMKPVLARGTKLPLAVEGFTERGAVRHARARGAQHAGAVHPAEASRADAKGSRSKTRFAPRGPISTRRR